MTYRNKAMEYAAELVQAERQADTLATLRIMRAVERDQSTTAVAAMLARMYAILLDCVYDDEADEYMDWLLHVAKGENTA